MSSHTRPAFLLSTLRYLESCGVTLTELLHFVLVSQQLNSDTYALYRDLLINAKSIMAALYYHPATGAAAREWAHDTMCALYTKALDDLARLNPDWQFIASQAGPEQIREFRIEDMATAMESQAPMLWSLLHALLGRHACHRAGFSSGLPDHTTASRTPKQIEGEPSKTSRFGMQAEDSTRKARKVRAGARRLGPGMVQAMARALCLAWLHLVILCILLQNRNQKVNALQSTVGIFLHACNTLEKVVKVLARMGVSISLTSIHRAVNSLSEAACREIEELGQTLLASFGYDNLELTLPTGIPTVDKPGEGLLHLTSGILLRLEHGVTREDLRCAHLLWERSPSNPHASDPRVFDPYETMLHLRTLHLEPSNFSGHTPGLTRRGRFRLWMVQRMLLEHGPTPLRSHLATLHEPDPVDAIPLVKSRYLPLRTMDLNQSKVSGNIDALLSMFAQAGVLGVECGDSALVSHAIDFGLCTAPQRGVSFPL
ncbi:hypothetical protein C8Q77DRAFT_1053195 [Trametes polyzona]|nr:hypothetical protein C8Q77DRAFT_1053195 [Trametes polyzona]